MSVSRDCVLLLRTQYFASWWSPRAINRRGAKCRTTMSLFKRNVVSTLILRQLQVDLLVTLLNCLDLCRPLLIIFNMRHLIPFWWLHSYTIQITLAFHLLHLCLRLNCLLLLAVCFLLLLLPLTTRISMDQRFFRCISLVLTRLVIRTHHIRSQYYRLIYRCRLQIWQTLISLLLEL